MSGGPVRQTVDDDIEQWIYRGSSQPPPPQPPPGGLAAALSALNRRQSIADLAAPPWFLVEMKVSDGRRKRTVRRKGKGWSVTTGRGRPGRDPEARSLRERALVESYEQNLKWAQDIRGAVQPRHRRGRGSAGRASPTNLNLPENRLAHSIREEGEVVVVLRGERRIRTEIQWDDFCRGMFEPRELAEHAVAPAFNVKASVVRKLVKAARAKRSPRRRSAR